VIGVFVLSAGGTRRRGEELMAEPTLIGRKAVASGEPPGKSCTSRGGVVPNLCRRPAH
jgi:hypothetical protein